ncbi:hypothetical protein B9Z55_018631 [Caenorhabditis nigoni]|uniref:Carboxylic ester hydrolase n=1 Tax=Caenorhabditis nigoni TaxID=1611254 RepID=A0A2G5TF30_9PELO|nr:hypothetical protein B9Z55_018631 [Caenorhabditis nigoni]
MLFLYIFAVMGAYFPSIEAEKNLKVLNASCGPVRGNIYQHGNQTVDGYLGIPFAKAPIGSLRYKKPVLADKWTETLDCYSYGPGCPQSGLYPFSPQGSQNYTEDNCLNLNVFVPKTKISESSEGLPVVVYFFGGGFEIGASSTIDDFYLSKTLPLKGLIVVTANYRVGPLGFFTTGDEVAKGNYGLWDQTLALKWVQEHIASFGGDPDSVTIFGTSAGAASVDFLALSPHSNKLFHRFMSNSGSAFCDFAIRPKELQATVFREFAKFQGYTGNDSTSLLRWYQDQDPKIFTETSKFQRPASGFLSFIPNFDGDFFPKPFDELRKMAPKIDVLATETEYEGLIMAAFQPKNTTFDEVVATIFAPDRVKDPEATKKKIVDFYMKDVDVNDTNAVTKKMIEFIGDSEFNIGALNSVRSSLKYGNNVYLGSFDYFNKYSENPVTMLFPFKAAYHGSDLRYILGESMEKYKATEEEFKVVDMMGTFVANFAKYGNPNGKNEPEIWEKYSADHPERYFKINYPKSEMKENFQNIRLKIYDEINANAIKYQEIVYGRKI